MFNVNEKKLLDSDASGFPMIQAASAALRACGTCGHKNVNVAGIFRLAVQKYAAREDFLQHCSKLFKLPCVLGGILVGK